MQLFSLPKFMDLLNSVHEPFGELCDPRLRTAGLDVWVSSVLLVVSFFFGCTALHVRS